MTATDPTAVPGGAKVSNVWWVLTAVAFVLAFGLGIGGCARFISQNTQTDQSVAVPGRGVVTVEEAETFEIGYQSTQFFDTGVCRSERRPSAATDSGVSSRTICDADLLAAEGQPTLREPGQDRITLTRTGDSLLRINDRITVSVWQVRLEPGDYELELADAPLGTERLVFESQSVELGSALLVVLSVPVFFLAVILLIVTLVRSSSRRSRRRQAAYPQTATPGWGPPGQQAPYGQAPPPPAPPPGWGPPPPPGQTPPGP